MVCRLFGSPDFTRFSIEMVLLIGSEIKSFIINWETVLSDKMASQILYYRRNRFVNTQVVPPFYMSAHIMDTIYFNFYFPILGWKWTVQDPTPIHIYHKYLWKSDYKNHIYRIFHGFVLYVHQDIFNKPSPWVSNEANIDLTSISSWFGEENFTYIRVLVSITYPHVLPLHIPDKLLPMEIAYQIVEKGMTRNLKDSKKKVWPPFPLRYGTYTLHDFKHAEKEVEKTKDLNLAVIPSRQTIT